jgi:hypothetical protein
MTTQGHYPFDLARCVVADIEVYPGRWCAGFRSADNGHEAAMIVDGDHDLLARTLDRLAEHGRTLVTYNGLDYDLVIMQAILAGEDPYEISRAIISHEGRGLPDAVKYRMRHWPRIDVDHIDLVARTRRMGRFPGLKTIAANLGQRRLQELPFPPDKELTHAEWEVVKAYNREVDLEATLASLRHFAPELAALAALSERFRLDLRSVHQAGISTRVLCSAYRRQHCCEPTQIATPESVRYVPPDAVERPRNAVAAAWFDALVSGSFPMVAKGENTPKPVTPEAGTITIGGVEFSVGQGGIHSVDRPAIHRSDAEEVLVDADVSSFYPHIMVNFRILPRSLGECGQNLFREILDTRLQLKRQAGEATDLDQARQLKIQADGLKIVLNSTFGQLGNPYSPLYDPEALLRVTLTGQLLLINLLEAIEGCARGIVSANTDGLIFKVRRSDSAWQGVLDNWQALTGMVLEITRLESLAIVSTNNYAAVDSQGKVKRRGTLRDSLDWEHVPHFPVVADAVTTALLEGTLPEVTVRQCRDPLKFTAVARRDRKMTGVLIDDATGTAEPVGRLVRFYKARGSKLRLEHRWTTEDGTARKSTPPDAREIRLLMELPETLPDDLDRWWYIGAARAQILKHRAFPHLDRKWLEGCTLAEDLHRRGLAPCPKWQAKKLPAGAKVDCPSFFWHWASFDAAGVYTGPQFAVLVLDNDEPEKFRKWVDKDNDPLFGDRWRTLEGALVSYHRDGTADAVRSGQGRGKLLFRFAAGPDHPLARMPIAHWKKSRGIEVFYGKGIPTVLGKHPDGPDQDYLVDGVLGDAPPWVIEGLMPKARSTRRRRTAPTTIDGDAVLARAVDHLADVPEGQGVRHCELVHTALDVGAAVAAGAVDAEEAERVLVEASTLPPDEASDAVQWAFGKASANGDGRADGASGDAKSKPKIEVNTELDRVRDEILEVLPSDPGLYRRGEILVRMVRVETPTYALRGGVELRDTSGRYTIAPLDEASFRCRLTTLAEFVKWERREGEWKEVPACPPEIPVRAVLNNVAYPGVRSIEGIVEVPYLRPDGTLCPPGYDERTGIVYIPGVTFNPLPEAPTQQDARDAAARLLEPVVQFPFATNEDRAVWLAADLVLVARPMIRGPVPGIAFIGNRAGIGKGKLVRVAGEIATGRTIPTTMYPVSKEETIKTKVALALAAATTVFFDNLEDGSVYGNGPLDSSITEMAMNERVLGMSKSTGNIELRPCWFLSGNNISPAKDAFRRWLVCNLKSTLENPEERSDIQIPDLSAHILARRGELLRDVLIILKAHAEAKRPTNQWAPLGSFEEWDRIIRGAVWFATGWDCNRSRKVAAEEAPDRLKKLALLEAWESIPGGAADGEGITVREAYARAQKKDPEGRHVHQDLHDAFMAFSKDEKFPSQETIGRRIGGMCEVVLDKKKFTKVGTCKHAAVWKVLRVGSI